MIRKNWLLAVGASGILALGLGACGDDDDSGSGDVEGPSGLSGEIQIDGSSTVQPFAEAAAELFDEENPDVNISVGAAGTGGGFERFCAGETQISDASRPIDEAEEVPLCEEEGIEYTEIQVANDGIAIATSPDLEISCLTTDQLAELWTDDSITELRGPGRRRRHRRAAPDGEVSLYGPGTDSGTFDYFTDVINGEEGLSRKDYQASEDDNQLVTGVAGDGAGLGYFGFSYYEQSADQLNLVSVDSGDGCVAPSAETIQDGSYAPLARPLFMYPNNAEVTKDPVGGFMQFVVDNYDTIAEAALIVPMDETQAEEAASALEGATGG